MVEAILHNPLFAQRPAWLFPALIALAIAMVLFGLFSSAQESRPRYKRISSLFTPAEQRFLQALMVALPETLLVFGKVRVADVLKPQKAISRKQQNRWFWKISSKHFDYVIVDRDTTQIYCVIELDDRSHLRSDRIARDKFLDSACESAGLSLLRFPVHSSYEPDAIRKALADAVNYSP